MIIFNPKIIFWTLKTPFRPDIFYKPEKKGNYNKGKKTYWTNFLLTFAQLHREKGKRKKKQE